MRRLWNSFEVYVANIALAMVVVMLTIQTFARYVFHVGLPWTEEISRFAFVIFVYISASLAFVRGTHITVSVLLDRLPEKTRALVVRLGEVMQIAFFLTAALAGATLIRSMVAYPVYSSAMLVPLHYIYAIIPLAYFLMAARLFQRMRAKRRAG